VHESAYGTERTWLIVRLTSSVASRSRFESQKFLGWTSASVIRPFAEITPCGRIGRRRNTLRYCAYELDHLTAPMVIKFIHGRL
jgi:hypothetical protein